MQAMGRAPGAERAFAMERWPLATDAALAPAMAALRAEANAGARGRAEASRGGRNRRLRPRRAHRSRARAATPSAPASRRALTLACRDADAARPPAPTGLVITNPPYGHRLGDARAAARGYRDLGRAATRALSRLARRRRDARQDSMASVSWALAPPRAFRCATAAWRSSCTSSTSADAASGASTKSHRPVSRRLALRRARPCPCRRARIRGAPPSCRTGARSRRRRSPRRARARRSADRRAGRRAFRGCGEAPGPPPAAAPRAAAARTPASPTRAVARAHSPPGLHPRRARRPVSSECPDR